MVRILKASDADTAVREHAVCTLSILSDDTAARGEMASCGGLEALIEQCDADRSNGTGLLCACAEALLAWCRNVEQPEMLLQRGMLGALVMLCGADGSVRRWSKRPCT